MDTRHMKQLAHFIRQNFDISNREDMPIIFDDYTQDYITEEVMRHIGDKK